MTPALLEVGRIEKAHGLRGQVIVRLITNRVERLEPGSELETDRGALIVETATPHGDRWLVAFRGIGDRDQADGLRGVVLRAEALDDPDEMWAHELIGATVVDSDGVERGVVVELLANPASDLLVLDNAALVPLNFVVNVDPGIRIDIDAPAGLFDL